MSYFFDLLDWRCCLPEPSDTFPCHFPADCSRVVTPDASAIPAMQRRRLSRLARASVSAMSPLVERYGNMPVVFCSRHGEMDRTLGLLRSLAQAEPLSPMSFSLSVHNAIVGQHSILSGNHHNVTAISGGTDELLPTLIEGCGQLESGVPQVMLVFADAPLPEPFVDYCSHPSDLYACAMVMSKGTTMSVAACGDILRQCPHPELPQSLALLHALALGAQPAGEEG